MLVFYNEKKKHSGHKRFLYTFLYLYVLIIINAKKVPDIDRYIVKKAEKQANKYCTL